MKNWKNKETLKNLPFVGKRLVGLYSRYLRIKNRKFLAKNIELKNKFSGKRFFVIATGPSIKNQDLKPLAGELSISVSNFFLHPDFNAIKPTFHLFAPSHLPLTPEKFAIWMKDAEKHFPDGQNILISISDKHIIEKAGVFKKQNVYYYFVDRKPVNPKKDVDLTKKVPLIQTSVHIAMFYAMYMGTKEICLLGIDHDWILHLRETKHFYDEKNSVLTQTGYDEWNKDLEPEFMAYVNLWKLYKKLKKYAEIRNIKLFNCTPESLLDVLPKKSLNEIFPKK